jgi:hypothetical protein
MQDPDRVGAGSARELMERLIQFGWRLLFRFQTGEIIPPVGRLSRGNPAVGRSETPISVVPLSRTSTRTASYPPCARET